MVNTEEGHPLTERRRYLDQKKLLPLTMLMQLMILSQEDLIKWSLRRKRSSKKKTHQSLSTRKKKINRWIRLRNWKNSLTRILLHFLEMVILKLKLKRAKKKRKNLQKKKNHQNQKSHQRNQRVRNQSPTLLRVKMILATLRKRLPKKQEK